MTGMPSAIACPTCADPGRVAGRVTIPRDLFRWRVAVILGAVAVAVMSMLDPFAPENTHPTPEMLAAWTEMMRDD